MSVNAKKGDIILSAEAGMTEDIVKTVSGYWEHAGMVIDDGFTIRHNTKYLDAMGIDYNYINLFFTRIKTTPRRLNPDQLANGMPGMITEDVNTAVNGEHARSTLPAASSYLPPPKTRPPPARRSGARRTG